MVTLKTEKERIAISLFLFSAMAMTAGVSTMGAKINLSLTEKILLYTFSDAFRNTHFLGGEIQCFSKMGKKREKLYAGCINFKTFSVVGV